MTMTPFRAVLGYAQAKAFPGLILFASVPLLISAFGPSVYGDYSRTWAAAIVSAAIFSGWLQQSLLRTTGISDISLSSVPKWLVLLVSLLAGLATSTAAALMHAQPTPALFWSALLFGSSWAYSSIGEASAQREGRIWSYSVGGVLRALGVGILPLALLSLSGVTSVSLIFLSGAVGALLATLVYTRGTSSGSVTRRGLTRGMLAFGWPMSLWLGLSSVLLYVDRWVVYAFASDSQAGIYTAYSDMVIRGFAMAGMPLSLAMHPHVMRLSNEGGAFDQVRQVVRKWQKFGATTLVAGVVASTLFFTLTGDEYLGLGPFPPVAVLSLSLGAALWQFALLFHKEHELAGQTRTLLLFLLISVVVEIAVLALGTPRLGVRGAALGVAAGASTYVGLVWFRRHDLLSSTIPSNLLGR